MAKYEFTPKDRHISWAQSFNLAVAILNPIMRRKMENERPALEESIRHWQQFFFYELTDGYTEFLKEEEKREALERNVDTKKANDQAKDAAENDTVLESD